MPPSNSYPIIAYIAYKPFGIDYLKRFLFSYSRYNSGANHQLLICFKGFLKKNETKKWEKLINCKFVNFFEKNEKNDFDIGSYFRIAAKFKNRKILFLDTHTRINCNNYLKIFLNNYNDNRVIGATGSYASISSQFLNFYYSQHTKFQQFRWGLQHLKKFKLFPNPHLRTTAFMLKGSDLTELNFDRSKFIKKIETNFFESGRNSMTVQLKKKGYEIGIVNSDNNFFKIKDWKLSQTYCLGKQSKLLFIDNRTDEYKFSNNKEKARMRKFSWGKI